MLTAMHRHELERQSAIDPVVIEERGYRTFDYGGRDEVVGLGIPSWGLSSPERFPGLLLPMYGANGEQISAQFKPAAPVLIKEKPVKYVSVSGRTNRLDVHPRNSQRIRDLAETYIGMIQRGERFRFPLEACEAFGVLRERVWQDLDRDLATERRVRPTPDLPHAAFAKRCGDLVDAETGAGSKSHVLWIIGGRAWPTQTESLLSHVPTQLMTGVGGRPVTIHRAAEDCEMPQWRAGGVVASSPWLGSQTVQQREVT